MNGSLGRGVSSSLEYTSNPSESGVGCLNTLRNPVSSLLIPFGLACEIFLFFLSSKRAACRISLGDDFGDWILGSSSSCYKLDPKEYEKSTY